MSIKQGLIDNIKNIRGWKTRRRIVVFSIDDYGNVRLDSKEAKEKMQRDGKQFQSRFDLYDSLENREDLEMLLEALNTVKDKNGRAAVFTPFALPCNIDFERMAEENYEEYHYELLPQTYEKLEAKHGDSYQGAWNLWKQGIAEGLLVPQFHGREHLNLKVFNEKLKAREPSLMLALKNRSFAAISPSSFTTIGFTAAFEFWDKEENLVFDEIIRDGLNAFERVYGYRSVHFNPPGGREHPIIHKALQENGIKYLDTPWVKQEHMGNGQFRRVVNHTGKENHLGMIYEVRNVVFEPTEPGKDWVSYALKQIETAFRWNRPALISSHRVNFCGHIDPNNRKLGISALQALLNAIVTKWPDVEFMSANQVGDLIGQSKGIE
jgi:hypothetical protein